MLANKITALLLALFFGLMAVLNFLFPDRLFSEQENRYLQEWPVLSLKSIFSGQFGDKFNLYIQDQFPVRDIWIVFKTLSEKLSGKKDNGRVYFGQQGYLLMIEPGMSQEQLSKNCAVLQTMLKELTAQNKSLAASLVLVPSAGAAMPDLLPPFAPSQDPSMVIQAIEEQLGSNAAIIDFLTVLRDAADSGRQIYYRTDHHWTTAGAFAAYQAWALAMGFEPLCREDFVISTVADKFYGTCWSQAQIWPCEPDVIESWQTKAQIDCSIWINGEEQPNGKLYDPAFLDDKDKYAYFLGGNYAMVDITTGIRNGRTLLVVKDSYANAFVPFLTQHYERIVMVDPRYLNISLAECLQRIGGFAPTDFLLLCQLEQFASDASFEKLS